MGLQTNGMCPAVKSMASVGVDDVRKAVKLFNRWQFQEAADAFQQLADDAEGSDRQFLLGLVEIAAGFFRIWHKNGEAHAMVEYLTKGMEVLRPFPKGALGIQAEPLLRDLAGCLEEAKRWRRGDSEIFNRDFIPRLTYVSRTGAIEE
jgi:hypothetical protein